MRLVFVIFFLLLAKHSFAGDLMLEMELDRLSSTLYSEESSDAKLIRSSDIDPTQYFDARGLVATGQCQKAEKFFYQAIVEIQSRYGVHSRRQIPVVKLKLRCAVDQKSFLQIGKFLRFIVFLEQKDSGFDSEEAIRSITSLAQWYRSRKDYSGAISFYEEAIARVSKSKTLTDPMVLARLNRAADVTAFMMFAQE